MSCIHHVVLLDSIKRINRTKPDDFNLNCATLFRSPVLKGPCVTPTSVVRVPFNYKKLKIWMLWWLHLYDDIRIGNCEYCSTYQVLKAANPRTGYDAIIKHFSIRNQHQIFMETQDFGS
jgi:hypothetical protein